MLDSPDGLTAIIEAISKLDSPTGLAVAVWIGLQMRELNKKMAKIVSDIEKHDRRIWALETASSACPLLSKEKS